MDLETDLACIAEQERRLKFDQFNEDTAWELGSRLRSLAGSRGAAVSIEVRLARETVFFCAMAGTAAANADWARRKRNTTELLARSSYSVGLSSRRGSTPVQTSMGLPERDYATHGGSFPIAMAGGGCIGAVTVSGLPQRDDHSLVVEALAAMLKVPVQEIALDRPAAAP